MGSCFFFANTFFLFLQVAGKNLLEAILRFLVESGHQITKETFEII